MQDQPLKGKVAVVAGGTRGAGRGISVSLGQAGATVYVTGRSVRGRPGSSGRPETIEETAEKVTAAGGRGMAARVDHTVESEVAALFGRVRQEQDGRLDLLVNDVWGGDELTEWNKPFWEHSLSKAMLDHFGVTEKNWREGAKQDPHFIASETPYYIGRAVVALARDPNVSVKAGKVFSTWGLVEEYGFTDADGRQPHWGNWFREHGQD